MKKIVIMIMILMLFTGCGTTYSSKKVNSNVIDLIFTLVDFYSFECENNVCTKIEEVGDDITMTTIISFENNIASKMETVGKNETYNIQYDYKNKIANLEYEIIENNTQLNITSRIDENNSYTCESNRSNWNPYDNFNLCDDLKTYIEEFIDDFTSIIEDNGSTIDKILTM